MIVTDEDATCERCDEPAHVRCSCGNWYCDDHFGPVHLRKQPTHRRGGTTTTDKAWAWVSGKIASFSDAASRSRHFQEDEVTKWFGLHVERLGPDRVTRLVETPRLSFLTEGSRYHSPDSPHRQFPSITSFVGETGAGKSTLIRSLICRTKTLQSLKNVEAPIPGAQSGSSICIPTTGEVNLYPDPDTFGTQTPHFYADCEGMLGAEPDAAQYQKEWAKYGRRYLLKSKDGKPIDRGTAVTTIYPRFLYIFSDVICMVTRNQKAWADSASKLLEWSLVGAHNTINQYALPALIIVLNAPSIEKEEWISDDHESATRDFFMSIEKEISDNATMRKMAEKQGDKTIRELFMRNFSSVHVHYIPLDGFMNLGNSRLIMSQIERLATRIKSDARRVQEERAKNWTLFDSRQLRMVSNYAFKHLQSGTEEPFDFSQCRQQMSLPESVEGHIAEFLGKCWRHGIQKIFEAAASIVGSCIVRSSLKFDGSDLIHPSAAFNKDFKAICTRAADQFLLSSLPCSYIHPETGEKCVNTSSGHAKGHQDASGFTLADGGFVSGDFDSSRFVSLVEVRIVDMLKTINDLEPDRAERRLCATRTHGAIMESIPVKEFWTSAFETNFTGNPQLARASVCYACLFGRPEYELPCGHVICVSCVREFDESLPDEKYPGIAIHKSCILCGSYKEETWPQEFQYLPDLSGIRVMSLDGGGVRGVIQLSILSRLEKFLNLEMPLGELFDLMVGTSAGGMIALGLGVNKFTVDQCLEKYKRICQTGLENKWFTKTRGIGFFARLFTSSIYQTEPLERSLREVFGSKLLFGLEGNATRVVITTTVEKDGRLLANYNWGDEKNYLDSNVSIWAAARCTSAAPMYFEPMNHDGYECRDGGLRENNPVQIAVNEARSLWNSNPTFDILLSVGSGHAKHASSKPSDFPLPEWLQGLFSTLIATMNGQNAWEKFRKNAEVGDRVLLSRSERLTVQFKGKSEPELDNVGAIPRMEQMAQEQEHVYCASENGFVPIVPYPGSNISVDLLEVLAVRLKGSLFFFEMKSLVEQDDVSIIKGWICCRLRPSTEPFRKLISQTHHFSVNGQRYCLPQCDGDRRFKIEVSFQQQASDEMKPIRLDVNFQHQEHPCYATISGFPMSLKMLKEYWDRR